jgi:hypothetical protein
MVNPIFECMPHPAEGAQFQTESLLPVTSADRVMQYFLLPEIKEAQEWQDYSGLHKLRSRNTAFQIHLTFSFIFRR